MNITVMGAGYVGLVTAACLAEFGNSVVCYDPDKEKIEKLANGISPIYEPGLEDMLTNNNLFFTGSTPVSMSSATDIFFIAVGTPSDDAGNADLSAVESALDKIVTLRKENRTFIVIKSTVPPGTAETLKTMCPAAYTIISNPEFLKEGAAIEDFQKPDRVIIGTDDPAARDMMRTLYAPVNRNHNKIIFMDNTSAEMTKYAANAMLATKISFINEMAEICEAVGADIENVRAGIGSDSRIGYDFIYPGIGYGGSCFPKDVAALAGVSRQNKIEPLILDSIMKINDYAARRFFIRVHDTLEKAGIQRVTIWGLSFKPETDDIRHAPALAIIDKLLRLDYAVTVYDPVATENVKSIYGDRLTYATDKYEAVKNAGALIICTEWREFRSPDFAFMKAKMALSVIFDGRNIYDPDRVQKAGFDYYSIGRKDRRVEK